MSQLDRLIIRELVPPFLFGVGLFTALIFAGGYLGIFTEYMVSGVPVGLVIELGLLFLPQIAVKTLPMGMLLATMLGFGRLSADWEVTALRAAGMSLRRLLLPVGLMGLMVSLFTIAFNETVVPYATSRANFLRNEALKTLKVSSQKALSFPQWKDGRLDSFVIVSGGRDPRTQELFQVTILKFSEGETQGPIATIFAERAVWQGGEQWRLENVRWHTNDGKSGGFGSGYSVPAVNNAAITHTPTQIEATQTEVDAKSFRQLRDQIAQYQQEGVDPKTIGQLTVELYNKLSLPLASLIFALVGTPLGIRAQRSSPATGFALSIAVIFVYWVLARYLIIIGGGGALPPWLASFLPNFLGIGFALYLLYRKEKI